MPLRSDCDLSQALADCLEKVNGAKKMPMANLSEDFTATGICRDWRFTKVRKYSVRTLVIWLRRHDFIRYSSMQNPIRTSTNLRNFQFIMVDRVPGHRQRSYDHCSIWPARTTIIQTSWRSVMTTKQSSASRRRHWATSSVPPALSRSKNYRFDRQLSRSAETFLSQRETSSPRRGSIGKHNWRAIATAHAMAKAQSRNPGYSHLLAKSEREFLKQLPSVDGEPENITIIARHHKGTHWDSSTSL